MKLFVYIILLLSLNLTFADRAVWYVHPDSTMNSIQAALDSCANNDIVLVGPGVYYENIVWVNTQGIHLLSELGPDTTIIDGDSSGNVIRITTGVDTTTIIRGFTIQNGFDIYGGGILCDSSSSPTITSNSIINNAASGKGGGIYICLVSAPGIDSCTISNNDGDGVFIDYSAAARINHNDIANNANYSVRKVDPGGTIDAEYNWWGDSTGPYHPDSNPGGLGDTVSDWVDFMPWLYWPGVEERPTVQCVTENTAMKSTIFAGPFVLPEGKNCKVFDITGCEIHTLNPAPGIYFIEVDGEIRQKAIKIR